MTFPMAIWGRAKRLPAFSLFHPILSFILYSLSLFLPSYSLSFSLSISLFLSLSLSLSFFLFSFSLCHPILSLSFILFSLSLFYPTHTLSLFLPTLPLSYEDAPEIKVFDFRISKRIFRTLSKYWLSKTFYACAQMFLLLINGE